MDTTKIVSEVCQRDKKLLDSPPPQCEGTGCDCSTRHQQRLLQWLIFYGCCQPLGASTHSSDSLRHFLSEDVDIKACTEPSAPVLGASLPYSHPVKVECVDVKIALELTCIFTSPIPCCSSHDNQPVSTLLSTGFIDKLNINHSHSPYSTACRYWHICHS